MTIPVRYWQLSINDFPLADVFNSSNFMFWHPGPDRHSPDGPPKGWASHVKTEKSYALVPHAALKLIRGSGVKDFLKRRASLLPRSGGFFVIWVKTMPPVSGHPFYAFSLGMAHFRHCGPSAPIDEFDTQENLPEIIRKWFPAELP